MDNIGRDEPEDVRNYGRILEIVSSQAFSGKVTAASPFVESQIIAVKGNRRAALGTPPTDVARQIVNAIEQDKPDVRIGWPERLFALINAVIPGIVDRGLRKNTAIGEEILKADQVVAPIPLIANKPDANPRSHPA